MEARSVNDKDVMMVDEVQEFSNALAYEYIAALIKESEKENAFEEALEKSPSEHKAAPNFQHSSFLPNKDKKVIIQLFQNASCEVLANVDNDSREQAEQEIEKVKVKIMNVFSDRCESEVKADFSNVHDVFKHVLTSLLVQYQSSTQAWIDWGLAQFEWGKQQVEASAPMVSFARDRLHGFFASGYDQTVAMAGLGVEKASKVLTSIDNQFRCGQRPLLEEEDSDKTDDEHRPGVTV